METMMGAAQTGVGSTMTGIQVGKGISEGVSWWNSRPQTVEYKGILPEEQGAAGGGEGWSSAGPIALGAGSMAFQTKANADYQQKGERSGNARYAEKQGPESENKTAFQYGYGAIERRGKSMKNLDPKEILSARESVKDLPLSEPDKINIGNKLSEMLKFIKIG